ncbi:MAG TPA: imidazoleglycerol-phosphate dehydratase HisB [Lentisphaeria bacterium]|nr:MAG: imidazoleglycerol-phosphate dehydratase [Lentisphaerae bacterium GWF2_50_93]HCE43115.1 imidazoleglycerol-phosphate dehydratase HisB [Lentisphaeria bacterium]
MKKTKRTAKIVRKTKETSITVEINLDGSGKSTVSTGIPFLNHMLELFAKHGLFDLDISAKGDLHIDCHHTIEDLGIVLGDAIAKATGDKTGIRRYGWCILPMDEALAMVSLDLSGRPYLVYDLVPPAARVKDIDTRLFHEFFQALSVKGGMNLHINLMKGEEAHHVFEAVFKAFAKALDQAVSYDSRITGVLSTKGML